MGGLLHHRLKLMHVLSSCMYSELKLLLLGCCLLFSPCEAFLSAKKVEPAKQEKSGFSVAFHSSSSTRYEDSLKLYGEPDLSIQGLPSGCRPIHYNLVARHGTREPTTKRMRELEKLAKHLREHVRNSSSSREASTSSASALPTWMADYRSPWEGYRLGGMLVPAGEEELFAIAQRTRTAFPEIFERSYHPAVFPIFATQVPRATASAVAFGMGLFGGKGSLGPGNHRPFAVVTESKDTDNLLRFHKTCRAYEVSKESQKPGVAQAQEAAVGAVQEGLRERFGLALSAKEVKSLWVLCKAEVAVLGVEDSVCSLLSPQEVEGLEWADDVEIHYLKGYGDSLNYRMGKPLLADVLQSMEKAVEKARDSLGVGLEEDRLAFLEKARLRFAHAETVIPFTCLLGLFQESQDVENVEHERAFPPPPPPPKPRTWRGNTVSPFAANTALVLYQCPKAQASSAAEQQDSDGFLVAAFHNERPVVLPACGGHLLCPFEEFKEKVAGPHMQHDFEMICSPRSSPPSFLQWISSFLLPPNKKPSEDAGPKGSSSKKQEL